MREQPLDVRLVKFDDIGDQQDLPRHAGLGDRGFEFFVDDAFMGGVLIDNDEAVAGLRHDVSLMHLRARGPERVIERIGETDCGFSGEVRIEPGAEIGFRHTDLECGLRRFSETAAARQRPCRARTFLPRTKGGNGCTAAGRRRARTVTGERRFQRVHDQGANQAGIAKAHFRFRRVHVDVDLARRKLDKQRHERMAIARQIIGIGRTHGAEEKLVAYRPSVDEQILAERIGARKRRQRRKAFDPDALAFGGDLDRVGAKIRAENVAEPREAAGRTGQRGRERDRRALFAGDGEGDVRPAHGEPAHHIAHGLGLGAIKLEKFQPRRRGVKQIAHLDARPLPQCSRFEPGLYPGIDFDRPGVRLGAMARRDRKPRHRTDRRQRLAAKAKRADRHQIVVGKFRRGVTLDRQHEIGTASCRRRRQ